MAQLINNNRYEEFKSVASVFNLRKEYPGYTGNEKYMLITDASEEFLKAEFPEEIKILSPYIICRKEMMEVVREYDANESKHSRRKERAEEKHAEEICMGEEYADLSISSFIDQAEMEVNEGLWEYSISLTLRERFATLSEAQKKRILMRAKGMTLKEIAEAEDVSINAVKKSVDYAKEVLGKDFYKKVRKKFSNWV